MEPEFREFRAIDGLMRAELFALSFPETSGTPAASADHYNWKFRSLPASRSSYEYVGAIENRLAAYYAALPYLYNTPVGPCSAGMVCDVMTHPLDRGKGLFTRIGNYATDTLAAEGLAFTTGYPIRPEVLPGHLKVGWKVVEKMPVWLRPVATRSLLPGPLKWLSPLLNPLVGVAMLWARPISPREVVILDRDEFLVRMEQDQGINSLINRWSKVVPISLHKDLAFFAWRTSAPGSDYKFALLCTGETVLGLAVLRPTTLKGIVALAVLDFIVDPSKRAYAFDLHHGIAKLAKALELDAVACMCSSHWASRYRFVRSGYLRTPATFSLIVKNLNQGLSDDLLYDASNWHPFWIDSDDL